MDKKIYKKIKNIIINFIENKITNFKYENGLYIYPEEIPFENTSNNIKNAAILLNKSLDLDLEIINPEQFLIDFKTNMNNFSFINTQFKEDYMTLLRTNLSNNNKLKWNVIFVQPNFNFDLHRHPNIEYIYMPFKKYALYEYRYKNIASNRLQIKKLNENDFIEKHDKIIINPINSLHNSFTKEYHCIFLVLWSGKHDKIPIELYPNFLKKEKKDKRK